MTSGYRLERPKGKSGLQQTCRWGHTGDPVVTVITQAYQIVNQSKSSPPKTLEQVAHEYNIRYHSVFYCLWKGWNSVLVLMRREVRSVHSIVVQSIASQFETVVVDSNSHNMHHHVDE
jgi:hypothetical protein